MTRIFIIFFKEGVLSEVARKYVPLFFFFIVHLLKQHKMLTWLWSHVEACHIVLSHTPCCRVTPELIRFKTLNLSYGREFRQKFEI